MRQSANNHDHFEADVLSVLRGLSNRPPALSKGRQPIVSLLLPATPECLRSFTIRRARCQRRVHHVGGNRCRAPTHRRSVGAQEPRCAARLCPTSSRITLALRSSIVSEQLVPFARPGNRAVRVGRLDLQEAATKRPPTCRPPPLAPPARHSERAGVVCWNHALAVLPLTRIGTRSIGMSARGQAPHRGTRFILYVARYLRR